MSWNLSLQLNNLWSAVRTIQNNFTLGLASNLRINTASSTTTYGIQDCASISANHTSSTLVLTNYAGLVGFTLDSVGNINIPTNLTLGYLNSAKTLLISGLTAYTNPPSPANTISISLTTPVAFYVYAGMYVTISLTSNPVFNGRYKILSILSAYIISIENPAGIIQGTTSIGGNLDYGYIGAVDIVSSGTITANQIVTATQTNSASASVTLSNTSPQYQLNTYGAGATTYTLPDATTLSIGTVYRFNNNSGGTNLLIRNYVSTLLYTMTNGGTVELTNLTNSTSAGTWDANSLAPSNATWGTGALTYNGNITLTGAKDVTVSSTGKVNTPLIKNGTSDITIGNAQNTAGGFVNIGVMNNASNTTPNVSQDSNNLSIGWNRSGGDAEIDFFNSSNAGFNFYARNSSSTIAQVARMRGDNVASYAFSIGAGAYAYLGAGSYGTSVGTNVGNASMSGGSNTLVGYATGNSLTDGYHNVCVGTTAGSGMTSGYKNTCIGWNAGSSIVGGSVNCYIGSGATASSGSVFGEIVIGQLTGNGNQTVTFGGAGASNAYFNGYTAGTPQFLSSGRLQNVSDIKTKSNILYLNKVGAIDTILKLKPAEFNYNADPYKRYCGFIADDVAEAMPNAVDGKKYKFYFETDADGKPKCDEDGNIIKKLDPEGNPMPRYLSLDTNEILSRSVLAIQEQQDEITSLKAQLASLKATVDALVASTGHLVV